jgi:hypothetical protein
MKNILLSSIVATTIFLTGCGSSGGGSDTNPTNSNVNLLGSWNVSIFDGTTTVSKISTFKKETLNGVCRAYHDPYKIDNKNMIFEHYT